MYYVFKPTGGTTSYGTLIEPQRPIPDELLVTGENGKPMPLTALRGKWLMVIVERQRRATKQCATQASTSCARCAQRRGRARTGGRRLAAHGRQEPVSDVIKNAYPEPDTLMSIADQKALRMAAGRSDGTQLTDHIFLVDPNGNLMMRFPKNPDPGKIKGDLAKLLKWSRIG